MPLTNVDQLISYIRDNKHEFQYFEILPGGESFKNGLLQACSDSQIAVTEFKSALSELEKLDFITYEISFNPEPLKKLLNRSPVLLNYLLTHAENLVESIKKAQAAIVAAAPSRTSRGPYQDAIFDYDPELPLSTLHELIKKIKSDGHDINQGQANNDTKRTPLYFAAGHIKKCGDKTIQLLIELSAKPDIPDSTNEYPLTRYLYEKYSGTSRNKSDLLSAINLFKEDNRLIDLLNQGNYQAVLRQLTLKFFKVTPDYYSADPAQPKWASMRSFLDKSFQIQEELSDMSHFINAHPEFFKSLCEAKSDAPPEVSAFGNKLFQYADRNMFRQCFDEPKLNPSSGEFESKDISNLLAINKPLYEFLKSNKSEIEQLENRHFPQNQPGNLSKP